MRTTYNGAVEGSFTSLPFGDGQSTTGTDTDASHYATLDHDSESDTEHAQFRQYSSAQGRWLSPDPYGGSYDPSNPQSFNRYVYVLNNPLSSVDLSGLDCAYDNGDETATVIGGDCGTNADGSPDNGYYVDCDGCLLNATAAILDPATGTLSFMNADGSVAGTVAGFGDPQGVTTTISVNAAIGQVDTFGYGGAFQFAPPQLQQFMASRTAPVGGIWTYGNYCGNGGAGVPVDALDYACAQHDFCYSQNGFSAGSNYSSLSSQQGAALQACNQALCDSAASIIASGQGPVNQAWSVIGYFGGILQPIGGKYTCR